MPHGTKDELGLEGLAKGYIKTKYGRFNPLRPDVKDVDVRDISYGLAGEFRYSGHSRLTVAQHSVVGSYYCDEPLAFLMHDATESLGFRDLATPFKHSSALSRYCKLELAALKIVFKAFKIPVSPNCPAVRSTDRAMYVTESFLIWGRDIQSGETSYPFTLDQFDQTRLWSPEEAERRFLARYAELTGDESVNELLSSLAKTTLKPTASCVLTGVSATKPFDYDMQMFGRGSVATLAATFVAVPSRPPNSFTHAEYVKENGVSSSSATAQIAKLRERGVVKPVRFSVVRSDGQKQTVGGWQLVDAPIDSGTKNV